MAIEKADIVIVGGAVVGSSIAYFLKRDGFQGSIVVVEKDPSYQYCATGRSLASIRQQFSTPENIRLSQFGVGFLKSIKQEFGPEADVSFRERGYLIMATPEGRSALEQNVKLQQSLGADTELLETDEIKTRFPWLSTEDVAAAGWGRSGEGWLDPHALMGAFRSGAREKGVTYLADEVVALETSGRRVTGVKLKSGGRISASTVVCAAGWHSYKIAAMAGFDLPVRPRKRLAFVVDCREPLPGIGMMIDPSGLAFRPEGRFYITSSSPAEGEPDPDEEDFEFDHGVFDRDIWPRLAARVPAFETLKVQNAWCCHYDVSTLDHNAILGPHPEVEGFILACGFSGHGLQHSPGVGRGIAELLTHGGYRTIDLTRFGYDRVLRGEPILESNVY
jgi:FAD-dependent oxidoreductase domain-containing protein 1